jgi:hypothetical protein
MPDDKKYWDSGGLRFPKTGKPGYYERNFPSYPKYAAITDRISNDFARFYSGLPPPLRFLVDSHRAFQMGMHEKDPDIFWKIAKELGIDDDVADQYRATETNPSFLWRK